MTTIDYICFGCAAMYGAEDFNQSATVHEGECQNCGDVADIARLKDWHWPDGRPAKWCEEHPDRPLSPLDKAFMQMMTEATGCGFIDVTPEKKP